MNGLLQALRSIVYCKITIRKSTKMKADKLRCW